MVSNIKRISLYIITMIFILSGCSTKVNIKALEPAEVGEMSSKKKISISEFRRDKVGLSGKIESKISKHKLDNKRYFSVLSRRDLKKVLKEQKLQSSALMDERTSVRVGKLIGAQAMINGEVASVNAESRTYYENRQRCLKWVKNEGCVKYKYYRVRCNSTQAEVSANINIVDIQSGLLIYGDSISKYYDADSCKNYGRVLSKKQATNHLTNLIADEFVYKLTPHYVYFDVNILDSLDIDLNDKQELLFKNSIEYIKLGRMDKAEKLLSRLMDQTDARSYVISYDYAVVKEANGELQDAKKFYILADEISMQPVKEINYALIRIDKIIQKTLEAKRQIDEK